MKKYLLIGILSVILIIVATIIFINSQNKKSVLKFDNLFLTGQYDTVITDATKRLAEQEDKLQTLLLLAATYAQKGSVSFREEENAEKAIEYADQAIQIDPKNSEAYRIKGYAYEIQEKYVLAHENYDQAIIFDQKNAMAISNKGHAYDLEGRVDKAQELYEASLRIDPSNSHALVNLARIYMRKNDLENARFTLNNLLTSNPQVRFAAEGYMTLAYIDHLEEDFDSSTEYIDLAIKTDPLLPQAYVQRARLILGSALNTETEAELQEVIRSVTADLNAALEINPNQTSAYIVFMELQFVTGDKVAQKDYLSKALQAVELDITLGSAEKKDVKRYLSAKVQEKK